MNLRDKHFAIAALATGFVMLCLAPLRTAAAQSMSPDAEDTVSDAIRQAHTMRVSPHLIVFDPHTRSTTVTFRNPGSTPLEAQVVIQYGYTFWQNTDTALFSPSWATEAPTMDPHDTVIDHPTPQDHDASRWLSGVPTHLVLAPHQTKQVTLRIDPPAHLPNGEYYARLVTIVRPPRHPGNGQDKAKAYALSTHARSTVPQLRDSARVFYREGPQSMRLTIIQAESIFDTTREAHDSSRELRLGRHPFRRLIRVHLAGTTHFEGYLSSYYLLPDGQTIHLAGDDRTRTNVVITIQRDGILRDLDENTMLTRGHYTQVVRFIPLQDEFPLSQRVPADTAQVSIPIDVP